MLSLLSVINKNFKLLIRSKLSALIIILAPLIIVLLISMAFSSSSLEGVKLGVYSNSYSDLTESVLKDFEDQNFIITKVDSLENCIESVKSGDNQICVNFPGDLSIDGNSESVTFYVDESRVNLAYTLINQVDSKIETKSSELGVTLASNLIGALEDVKSSLPEPLTVVTEAKTEVAGISDDVNNIQSSVSSFDSSIESLTSVRDSISNVDSEDPNINEINSVISDLESIQESNEVITSEASSIESRSSTVVSKLNEINTQLDNIIDSLNDVKIVEAQNIVSPIRTEIESVNSESSNANFLFPTLVTLLMLFSGIILASSLVIREKNTKAYLRNFITPTKEITFLVGGYITALIIILLQLLILFLGAIFVMDMNLGGSLWKVSLILLISSSVFIILGMIIGYLFRSEETSVLASISLASLMMFFSNAILPIEAISSKLKALAFFNPVVVSDAALKKLILFDAALGSILLEIILLSVFLVVVFVLAFLSMELTKRKV